MRNHQQLLSKSTKTLDKLIGSSSGESSEEGNFHDEQEKFYQKGDNFVAKFQDSRATAEVNPQEKNSEVIYIVDDTTYNLLVLFSFLE